MGNRPSSQQAESKGATVPDTAEGPAGGGGGAEQEAPAPAPLPTVERLPAAKLPSDKDLMALEQLLGYSFKDKWTLRLALLHPSFGEINNSRLSWLGDAVLGAAVADLLFQELPDATTATLNDRRTTLVRCEAFAAAAWKLDLHELMAVGRGYEGLEPTPHMLAECFEAVWGAIYVDAGYSLDRVKVIYARLFPLEGVAATVKGKKEEEAVEVPETII